MRLIKLIDLNIMNNEEINEDKKKKKDRGSTFIILVIITTVGVMLAIGLSFSAIEYMDSNETINTLISKIKGDDNKDKYIVTYVENTGDYSDDLNETKDKAIYIKSAKFYSATDGSSGEVLYFSGVMITTRSLFKDNNSEVIYEVILQNDSSSPKAFYGLNFNKDGDVKYEFYGINKGDVIDSKSSKKMYIKVTYNNPSKEIANETIESTATCSFEPENANLHIESATKYKTTNDGEGEVIYYGGMMLTTKTTLKNSNSTVTYKIVIKNDSTEGKAFTGLNYSKDLGVKYTLVGLEEGEIIRSGKSVVVYLTLEADSKLDNYPTTVDSSINFDFVDFGVSSQQNGIYLVNQFPVKDEVGKAFQGKNYIFKFSLILGRKTEGVYYEITAVPNEDNTLNPSYVKLYLEKDGKGVDLSFRNNGKVKVFSDYQKSEHEDTVGSLIYKSSITKEDIANGKIDFVLRMWISEDVNIEGDNIANFVNRKFGVRINTYAMNLEG